MDFPFKIGLKLYSTNTSLIPEALLIKNKFFNYVELYVIPGSYEKTISAWKEFAVPFVIHAPHSFHGVNLARFDSKAKNIQHLQEVQRFADELNADIIVVHGGNNGDINETIEELLIINDARIVIENKPKIGTLDELCIGWSPQEFNEFREAGVLNGIALDFTHAVCAARAANTDQWELIQSLMAFKPKIFHLSDTDSSSHKDMHLNLGKGSLNLQKFFSFVSLDSLVTIETPRKNAETLSEFVTDIEYIQRLSSKARIELG
ncbi:MAG: TIM barrel protein [Smithella sp.]